MSKKEVSSDYLRARGLSENEILVYSTVLGLGSATVGEINLAITMELPEIYIQLRQLQEINYIKQIPSKVPRYVVMEPFLKDYVQLTNEMKLGLINIKDNFIARAGEFVTKINTIVPGLSDFCHHEKDAKLESSNRRVDRLEENIKQLLDNSYLQLNHLGTTLATWPSDSIEKTLPAFEDDLENSKDTFVSAISKYADSLVVDSRDIRDKLEKETIHHKIMVAERLEKLKSDIDQSILELKDIIITKNHTISSSYNTNLDQKDVQARENAANVISNLIQNVTVLAREKEGDISNITAQMINNSLKDIFLNFDFLQNEVKSTLNNLLNEHSEDVAKLVRQTSTLVESSIPEVLEIVTTHLEESRDKSAKFIDQKITDPFKELEKMKSDIAQDIQMFKNNIRKEANKQDEIAKASIADRLQKAEERVDLQKIELQDSLSLSRIEIEDLLQDLIKNVLNENASKIEETTLIINEAGLVLENTLGNTIYLLDNTGKTFEGIVNMSEKVMPIDEIELELIYGNISIERIIKDMLIRTKEEIILITPSVITEYLYEIEKLPQIANYQIISNIKEEDVGLLSSLVKRGNVTTLSYKDMDFWIAIRDNEEIVYAPKIHKEKNIAFYTTNPKLFKIFFDLTNQNVFSKMKTKDFQI